jgi:hypothetical protein
MKQFNDIRTNVTPANDIEEFNESFFKSASKLVVANKVRTLSGQVKKERKLEKKLDLIASQNTWIAGLCVLTS